MQKATNQTRIVALSLLSALFFGCEDPQDIRFDLGIGGQLTTNFSDSTLIERFTMQLDSVITSDIPEIMFGGYDDPLLGQVNAEAYVQPNLIKDATDFTGAKFVPFDLPATSILDSAYIILNYNGYFQGDSLQPMTVDIYQTQQPILAGVKYTNDSQIQTTTSEPLATLNFRYRSISNTRGDTLFAISAKLPQLVLDQLAALREKPEASDANLFARALPGFVLKPRSNRVAYAFRAGTDATSSSLRLFYRLGTESTVRAYTFPFTSGRFTKFTVNRNGSRVAALTQPNQLLPASQTENLTYIQAGTGIATVFDFKNLSNIISLPEVAINKADFIIQVDSNFIAPRLPVPPVVVLAELDENNKIVKTSKFEPVLVPINANSPNAGQGSLFLATTKTYAFNVTSYLQKIASEGRKSVRLALIPGGFISTSSTQSIINHSNVRRAAIKSAKLNVFYTYSK
ncbi:MAG: DUF4270 family protein [Spirosomataceae bacterium]